MVEANNQKVAEVQVLQTVSHWDLLNECSIQVELYLQHLWHNFNEYHRK